MESDGCGLCRPKGSRLSGQAQAWQYGNVGILERFSEGGLSSVYIYLGLLAANLAIIAKDASSPGPPTPVLRRAPKLLRALA